MWRLCWQNWRRSIPFSALSTTHSPHVQVATPTTSLGSRIFCGTQCIRCFQRRRSTVRYFSACKQYADSDASRSSYHHVLPCPWLASFSNTTGYSPEVGLVEPFPTWMNHQGGVESTFLRHLGSEYANLYNRSLTSTEANIMIEP
jgi:hypothetical protein